MSNKTDGLLEEPEIFDLNNPEMKTIKGRKSHKSNKNLTEEMKELLVTIDSLLVKGDANQIALECGVSRRVVYSVLIGESGNKKVLWECYKKALANKKDLANIFINPKEALKKLKS